MNVVRDGRDVFLSHKEVKVRHIEKKVHHNKKSYTVKRISKIWNSAINKGIELEQSPDLKERSFTIRYEQLLTAPEENLSKLFHFLELKLEDQILHPEKFSSKDTGALIDDVWYTEALYNSNFDTSKIGRWQNKLSWLEKRSLSKLMGENLNKLGYKS